MEEKGLMEEDWNDRDKWKKKIIKLSNGCRKTWKRRTTCEIIIILNEIVLMYNKTILLKHALLDSVCSFYALYILEINEINQNVYQHRCTVKSVVRFNMYTNVCLATHVIN